MRYARVFFIIVIFICVFETIRLWFLAPDVMASHFNVQGDPDNFVPKLQFFSFQVQTVLVVFVVSLVVQVLTMIISAQWINVPHREYWLSPERRQDTLDRIGAFGAALFAIILLVIQAAFELSVSANLQTPVVFAAQLIVPMIVGFLVLSFMLLFWFIRSFRLPSY